MGGNSFVIRKTLESILSPDIKLQAGACGSTGANWEIGGSPCQANMEAATEVASRTSGAKGLTEGSTAELPATKARGSGGGTPVDSGVVRESILTSPSIGSGILDLGDFKLLFKNPKSCCLSLAGRRLLLQDGTGLLHRRDKLQ